MRIFCCLLQRLDRDIAISFALGSDNIGRAAFFAVLNRCLIFFPIVRTIVITGLQRRWKRFDVDALFRLVDDGVQNALNRPALVFVLGYQLFCNAFAARTSMNAKVHVDAVQGNIGLSARQGPF